jgi:tetratricopeptide (TPR) repeat protein
MGQLLAGDRALERCNLPFLPASYCRGWLARSLAEVGEFQEGTTAGEEAIRLAEAVNHPFTLATALVNGSAPYLYQGDFVQGIALLERGLAAIRDGGFVLLAHLAYTLMGYALLLAGRGAETIALLEPVLAQGTAEQPRDVHAYLLVRLGEAYLETGRCNEAANLAGLAAEYTGEHGERGNKARALRLLGEIAASADPPDADQAENYYRLALSLADELGMRPLVAHCHLGLGTLYQKVGRHAEAQSELATTAEAYRAMEMTYWLRKAEAALAGVRTA